MSLLTKLTAWSKILETGPQQVKKFPELHRTRRFITALITVRYTQYIHPAPPTAFLYTTNNAPYEKHNTEARSRNHSRRV